jgi:putative heme iron utilization protein
MSDTSSEQDAAKATAGGRGDAPSAAAQVRGLLRRAGTGTLASALARDRSGWPYPSLVLLTVDHAGQPLLLLSDLADHTANLKADPRLGLLVGEVAGLDDPLTGPRAGILGTIEPAEDPALLERVVRRHPGAAGYAGFADFRLYRLHVARAHLVAGFGRIHWLDATELLFDTAGHEALAAAEAGIVAHMNEDHLDAIAVIAARILGRPGEGWSMTGVDPEGCDLRRGPDLARVAFEKPVHDAETCRVELVRLTRHARRLAGEAGA